MIDRAGLFASLDRAFPMPLDEPEQAQAFSDQEEEIMAEKFYVGVYQKRLVPFTRLQWRFRAISKNGNVLAGGESYNNYHDMRDTIDVLFGPDVEIRRIHPGTNQSTSIIRPAQ